MPAVWESRRRDMSDFPRGQIYWGATPGAKFKRSAQSVMWSVLTIWLRDSTAQKVRHQSRGYCRTAKFHFRWSQEGKDNSPGLAASSADQHNKRLAPALLHVPEDASLTLVARTAAQTNDNSCG